MAKILQVLPDPFHEEKVDFKEYVTPNENKYNDVRRAVKGLQIKPETFALLELKSETGQNLLMIDSGGPEENGEIGYGPRNSNFLVQSVSEQRAEKQQIVETFGPLYIFFFGERPTMLNVSGVLYNSSDFNWKNEFLENYDRYLRGTQCARNGTRVFFSYDDVTKPGYMMSCSIDLSADSNELCNFSFQMIVGKTIHSSIVGLNRMAGAEYREEPSISFIDEIDVDTDPPVKATLLDRLQEGYDKFDNYKNKAADYITFAQRYITGSTLSIPQDIYSSILFDKDSTVEYKYNLGGQKQEIMKVENVKFKMNDEEYISRLTSSEKSVTASFIKPNTQLARDVNKLKPEVDKILKKFGVKSPPSKTTQAILKGSFQIVNVGVTGLSVI